MNDFEARQEARRARLLAAAQRERAEADRRWRAGDDMGRMMNGQPILVGHHSEKRHRRDIERMHSHARKGSEAWAKAKDLERAAEAVGTGGISSDDPEAVVKLRAKLRKLEAARDQWKALNAHWRKHGTCAGFVGAITGPISEETAARLDAEIPTRYTWERQPVPKWKLTNAGAEIRRLTERIKSLEAAPAAPVEVNPAPGVTVREDPEDNRLWLVFAAKPDQATRTDLKRFGFRWSPQRGAWVRHLNNAGRSAANAVLAVLAQRDARKEG